MCCGGIGYREYALRRSDMARVMVAEIHEIDGETAEADYDREPDSGPWWERSAWYADDPRMIIDSRVYESAEAAMAGLLAAEWTMTVSPEELVYRAELPPLSTADPHDRE